MLLLYQQRQSVAVVVLVPAAAAAVDVVEIQQFYSGSSSSFKSKAQWLTGYQKLYQILSFPFATNVFFISYKLNPTAPLEIRESNLKRIYCHEKGT